MPRSFALLAVLAIAFPALAQQGPRIDVAALGPQVGQQVRNFSLVDQNGRTQTLQSIMGQNGAMLVFSRSVDWCPYCKTQMVELQGRLAELRAQGLGLAVITYDSPAIMADFARRRSITFPLLSDAGSATIRAYGILNTTVAAGTSNYGIPFPGTIIVDRRGRVTSRYFEEAYQERNSVSTILLTLGKGRAPVSASRVDTDHLQVTTYASDETVAPGTLFSLAFDVTPKRGMHVYAPGSSGYRVISVRLDPHPLVTTRPIVFPPSEIYEFKPLNERVPVYQKPFRLVQTLSITPAADKRQEVSALRTLTLKGALEYQACDDAICYPPRTVPVSYTVKVRPLDQERSGVAAR